MTYHPVVGKIREMLDVAGIAYKTFEHAPVRTSEEAAALRPEYNLHQGAKALIVRVRLAEGKKFVMLIVPGDQKFNESKVKAALGAKEVRFATEQEVGEITNGVQIGGVPPFGNLFGLAVYADNGVFGNDEIIFNAGDRAFSIAMKSSDWRKVVNPTEVDIV
ncbi:MAG TPA: YbaK/EbsC family protein [Candidatus Paceibacterota bacterium]